MIAEEKCDKHLQKSEQQKPFFLSLDRICLENEKRKAQKTSKMEDKCKNQAQCYAWHLPSLICKLNMLVYDDTPDKQGRKTTSGMYARACDSEQWNNEEEKVNKRTKELNRMNE